MAGDTPLPSIGGLRAFVSVSWTGTFTLAAAELGLTQAAVSYLVSTLETALGVVLLVRARPRVQLTAAGTLYLDFARTVLTELEAGKRALERQAESRASVLRVSVTEAFATLWLVPRLYRFQKVAPEAQVAVTSWVGGQANDVKLLEREEVQACITYSEDRSVPPTVAYHELAADFAFPVCSPALAQNIRTVPDLRRHTLLHALTGPHHWRNWLKAAGHARLAATGEMQLQHSALCVQAAMSGLGVAMAHSVLVADLLRGGALVAPLPKQIPLTKRYALLCRRGSAEDALIRGFRDWLAMELAADEGAAPLARMETLRLR